MPLPLSNLDDRRWADLVEEGRAMIPRHARSWTDHNVHDPGITLISCFAWLAEMNIYRLNQVPERHRRNFLALMGFIPQYPQPAQTMLAFSLGPGTARFDLPAEALFESTNGSIESVPFRTLQDLAVVDARLVAVQVKADIGLCRQWRVYQPGDSFYPFGSDPEPGASFYLAFDKALLPGESVSLGFCLMGDNGSFAERYRIFEEARKRATVCRRPRPGAICNGAETTREQKMVPKLLEYHSARLAWEYYATQEGGRWLPLSPENREVRDDTRSLTLSGTVRLTVPTPMESTPWGNISEPLYYLRCRLAEGQFDAAPQFAGISINAVTAEQTSPAWQQFTIAPDATVTGSAPVSGTHVRLTLDLDPAGIITALDVSDEVEGPTVPILGYSPPDADRERPGLLTVAMVCLGVGDGSPNQQASLPHAPVFAESVALYTLENSLEGKIWRVWTRREDLDASRRTDYHYTLNATTGEIITGTGERGCVLPPGALVLVSYDVTRAEQGNVPADAVTQLVDTPVNPVLPAALPEVHVTNTMPATGGTGAENLVHATGRAVETLWAHERLQSLSEQFDRPTLDEIPGNAVRVVCPPSRALSTLDIERLALAVPGTQVRRARAWSSLHPGYPCLKAEGVVTLIIVPELPRRRPQPSKGLLAQIRRYLELRRMVTTRIEVVGPYYLEVSVYALVRGCPGSDPDRLSAAVKEVVERFLDPLQGGPDGLGWPLWARCLSLGDLAGD